MVILNFLTEKVRKYQEKKLNDALQKIKLHQEIDKGAAAPVEHRPLNILCKDLKTQGMQKGLQDHK